MKMRRVSTLVRIEVNTRMLGNLNERKYTTIDTKKAERPKKTRVIENPHTCIFILVTGEISISLLGR